MKIQKSKRIEIAFFILFILGMPFCYGQAQSIKNGIPVPNGYLRKTYASGSFSHWIQNLPLKDQPVILNYRGEVIQSGFYNVWGVVRMPLLFRSDLEQCADFAMRFWAEYHKAGHKLDSFYLFDYNGHKSLFKESGKTLTQFLKWAFANTNSYSLKKGCADITSDQVVPGDILIQNEKGGVGHVSVIMDVCESKEGKKLYLIGYSFMPAQEFHIEKAREEYGVEGWFTLEGYARYLKDFLDYGQPVLRRFNTL
jgi:hypothetical protein